MVNRWGDPMPRRPMPTGPRLAGAARGRAGYDDDPGGVNAATSTTARPPMRPDAPTTPGGPAPTTPGGWWLARALPRAGVVLVVVVVVVGAAPVPPRPVGWVLVAFGFAALFVNATRAARCNSRARRRFWAARFVPGGSSRPPPAASWAPHGVLVPPLLVVIGVLVIRGRRSADTDAGRRWRQDRRGGRTRSPFATECGGPGARLGHGCAGWPRPAAPHHGAPQVLRRPRCPPVRGGCRRRPASRQRCRPASPPAAPRDRARPCGAGRRRARRPRRCGPWPGRRRQPPSPEFARPVTRSRKPSPPCSRWAPGPTPPSTSPVRRPG